MSTVNIKKPLCEWKVPQGTVNLFPSKTQGFKFYLIHFNGYREKIRKEDIVVDKNFSFLVAHQRAKDLSVRFARLSDNSGKLYMNFTLLGGMFRRASSVGSVDDDEASSSGEGPSRPQIVMQGKLLDKVGSLQFFERAEEEIEGELTALFDDICSVQIASIGHHPEMKKEVRQIVLERQEDVESETTPTLFAPALALAILGDADKKNRLEHAFKWGKYVVFTMSIDKQHALIEILDDTNEIVYEAFFRSNTSVAAPSDSADIATTSSTAFRNMVLGNISDDDEVVERITSLRKSIALSNADLEHRIRERLPTGTYSDICVRTMQYRFRGRQLKQETRQIELNVSGGVKFLTFFTGFFSAFGDEATGVQKIDKGALGKELIQIVIAGSDGEGDTTQLELAYQQARTVKLYIAKSLKDVYLEISTSSDVIGYNVGDWTKKVICLIPKLIVAIGNVAEAINKASGSSSSE